MLQCERCLSANPDEAHFCMACGSPTQGRETDEERKLVTVLFADMVGSTAEAHGSDPEDVRDRLRQFFDPIRERIRHYDGTVEKFIGDAVVAVFGAPRAHGDDAQRAVRCGMEIVRAIAGLNERDPDLRLAVRVGVSTGEAVVSLGDAHERGESIATGDALNIAARLQAGAPPGSVVVSSETRLATRRVIRYELLPALVARGKPDPLERWRAVAPADPIDGALTIAPLVGRSRELQFLDTAVQRTIAEKRPALLSVLGPPGIGKSRLVYEFARSKEVTALVLRGRCLPYEERGGYAASIDQIKTLAGILESDPPQKARGKLETAVAANLPPDEVADVTRYLSLLIGLGIDEPIQVRQPLFYAMRRLIEGACRDRPALLIFEDLHWGDESQFELLEYLATHVSDVSVLFVVVARPELADRRPALADMTLPNTVSLEPLAPAGAAAVAGTLLAGLQTRQAIDRLVEASGGNPLFLEELVLMLPGGGDRPEDLPATVREAIAWRVDSLPTEQRTVLLDASVIGATFWRGILAALHPAGVEQLDATLAGLVSRGLVREVRRARVAGEQEFVFKHALVREVAYRTLTRASRRERHGIVARHIELALAEHARELAAILAHHWRQAGESQRAVEYLLIAARRAVEGWAPAEAQALYEEALELAGDDPVARTRIRAQRGLGQTDLSNFEASAAELDEVLPLLEGRLEAEALIVRARVAYWLEDPGIRALSDRGRELAESLPDSELVGPAMISQGLARVFTGELREAASVFEQARTAWPAGTRQSDFAVLNEHSADVAYWLGEYTQAEEFARRAHELGGETHNLEPLLRSGGWRGLALAAQGRSEEAIEWLDSLYGRAQQVDTKWGAASMNYSSLAFRDMHMFDEARRRNQRALELVSERGAWGMAEIEAEIDLMVTDLALGEAGPVQQSFPKLWDAALSGQAWQLWLGGGRLALVRAQLARLAEGPDEVVRYATDALERAQKIGRRKYEAAARALLGEALVSLGAKDHGVAELRSATAIADGLGAPSERWRITAVLARLLYATGDDAGAAAAYENAAGIIIEYAKGLKADHAAIFLAAEPVREVLKAAGRRLARGQPSS